MADQAAHVFDFDEISSKDKYKLLSATIIPRPVALVTTLSSNGTPNAAPFSFFNILSHDPAIMAIGIEKKADGSMKDTAANILDTGEFTVHITDIGMIDQLEICGQHAPPEVDELHLAHLETAPGAAVACPRILKAPAAFECKLVQTIELSPARVIVLGRVQRLYLRKALVDVATLYVDQHNFDPVGRLGGKLYARQRDTFEK